MRLLILLTILQAVTGTSQGTGVCSPSTALAGGRAAYDRREYAKAVTAFETAIAECASAERLVWLGRAYGQEASGANIFRKPSLAGKARAAFEQAVALDPKNRDALDGLFVFYLNAPGFIGGGLDKARRQAEAIRAVDPARGAVAIGRIAEHEERLDEAERAYRKAAIDYPQSPAPLYAIGYMLARLKRYPEAHDTFARIVRDHPRERIALYQIGRVALIARQRMEEGVSAIASYVTQPAPDDGATHALAYQRLGQLQAQLGKRDLAIEAFRRSLALAPGVKEVEAELRKLGAK